MKGYYDVILQGGGRIVLAFLDDINPDELGHFKHEFEKQQAAGVPLTLMSGVREVRDNRPQNEMVPTRIITRDRSNGRYHHRYIEVLEDGTERTLVDERCQTDQSGKFDVLDELPESADRNTLCRYCMPGSENLNG